MYDVDKIVQLLGGERVLGAAIGTPLELCRMIQRGMPVGVVMSLAAHLSNHAGSIIACLSDECDLISIASAGSANDLLSIEESNRVCRFAGILAHASDTFGSFAAAETWLTTPHTMFDKAAPIELIDTDIGYEVVETALVQIDHGIAA
jgi:putative toxin-antitoxin system antitoxin component (TIGR02293 family)